MKQYVKGTTRQPRWVREGSLDCGQATPGASAESRRLSKIGLTLGVQVVCMCQERSKTRNRQVQAWARCAAEVVTTLWLQRAPLGS